MSKADSPGAVADFPRMSWRRRFLVIALAVATAVTIVLTLLNPPGGVKRHKPPPPDVARCEEGQTRNCVGGVAGVIVAPAASAAQPNVMR